MEQVQLSVTARSLVRWLAANLRASHPVAPSRHAHNPCHETMIWPPVRHLDSKRV